MKNILFIVFLLMFSCNNKHTKVIDTKTTIKSEKHIQKNDIHSTCENSTRIKSKSQLICKIEVLKDLKNDYQLKKIENNIGFENTQIYRALKYWTEQSPISYPRKKKYFEQIDNLKLSIQEVNYCKIKGTYPIGGTGGTYPRASIEELIFNTEDCATKYMDVIREIQKDGYLMERIDKSPNSIFQEKNMVYYISSGGWFMMDFYGEIEKNMKNKICNTILSIK